MQLATLPEPRVRASSAVADHDSPVVVSLDVDESAWDTFVRAHPFSSGYHLWRWRRVFERAFGHDTVYLTARQDGAIVGVLPLVIFQSRLFGRFAVSLPFVNYGGVVATTDVAAQALVDRASALAVRWRLGHIELRHVARQFERLAVKEHKVAMILPLAQSRDAAWDAIDRKARNQVRKAEKSGLTASIGGRDRLAEFYDVFAQNMRDLGTPVYSRRFFEEVLEQNPEATRVIVVSKGQTPVAAGITYQYNDTIEVPWASSLQEHLALCPNNLLYWTILQDAVDRGLRYLDFGRSTPNEGTYRFKQQWGAEPHPMHWEYCLLNGSTMPDQSPKNAKFRYAIAAWQRLPVGMTRILGPYIVRSIP